MAVPPQGQQRRRHHGPTGYATRQHQRRTQQQGQHREDAADRGAIRRRGKGMDQAGVFGNGQGRHRPAGQGTLQHKPHPETDQGAAVHGQGGAQGKIGHKVAADPDQGESPAVGILENFLLFGRVGITGQCVAGVGVPVQMNSSGEENRQQAISRRLQPFRYRPVATHRRPQSVRCRTDHAHQREGAKHVPHVFFVPGGLRHGDGTEHGKRHRHRFGCNHSASLPL